MKCMAMSEPSPNTTSEPATMVVTPLNTTPAIRRAQAQHGQVEQPVDQPSLGPGPEYPFRRLMGEEGDAQGPQAQDHTLTPSTQKPWIRIRT